MNNEHNAIVYKLVFNDNSMRYEVTTHIELQEFKTSTQTLAPMDLTDYVFTCNSVARDLSAKVNRKMFIRLATKNYGEPHE